MKPISVPLQVDSQVKIPVGPFTLPLRTIALLLGATPLLLVALKLPLPGVGRFILGIFLLFTVGMISAPTREGIWIGTWLIFKGIGFLLPLTFSTNRTARGKVKILPNAVLLDKAKSFKVPKLVKHLLGLIRIKEIEEGYFRIVPGGWRVMLKVAGPTASINSESYAAWCQEILGWIKAVDCPAQLLAIANHYDRQTAQETYDEEFVGPDTLLKQYERNLVGDVAAQSLAVDLYVVFSPGIAAKDGVPDGAHVMHLNRTVDADENEVGKIMTKAQNIAAGSGLEVWPATAKQIKEITNRTVIGASEVLVGSDSVIVDGECHVYGAVTKLAPAISYGTLARALLGACSQGVASLHLIPVDPQEAVKKLSGERAKYKYAAQKTDDVDVEYALRDTEDLLSSIAGRLVSVWRIAVSVDVAAPTKKECDLIFEQVDAALSISGLKIVRTTVPAFRHAFASAPGCGPLGRSLIMTTDGAAGCMIPAVATPFGDVRNPLVGYNYMIGSPAYYSIWNSPNFNALIVGSSGAGKSATAKCLLMRHAAQGARIIVLDPESEYEKVMMSLGGNFFELGKDSLNVLASGLNLPPDKGAGEVVDALSVMCGDEVGYQDGRPIRRLPAGDKARLHTALATFYEKVIEHNLQREPVLTDFVNFLNTTILSTMPEGPQRDRWQEIVDRLRGFTQGAKAGIFNKPTSFNLNSQATAIGFREMSLQYSTDLTPALAVVLSAIIQIVSKRQQKTIIFVDEAHLLFHDPDAGQVLDQLVRRARKSGAAVWCATQAVEDVLETDLGRTIATNSATKLILGLEASVADRAKEAFLLTDEEMSYLSPRYTPGRGVLISGEERAVISVVPGDHLTSVVFTNAA